MPISGAFAVVIAVSNLIGSDEIDDYNGLDRRSPFLAFAMLMFLLSLAGVPPLAGFIGKLYIFVAAIKEGTLHADHSSGLSISSSRCTTTSSIVKKMYINEPTDRSPLAVSPSMQAVIYVGLAGTLILGIYPKPFIEWAVSATLMFSQFAPTAAVPPVLPFGG